MWHHASSRSTGRGNASPPSRTKFEAKSCWTRKTNAPARCNKLLYCHQETTQRKENLPSVVFNNYRFIHTHSIRTFSLLFVVMIITITVISNKKIISTFILFLLSIIITTEIIIWHFFFYFPDMCIGFLVIKDNHCALQDFEVSQHSLWQHSSAQQRKCLGQYLTIPVIPRVDRE